MSNWSTTSCRPSAAAAACWRRGARLRGPGRVRGPSRYELALGGGARKAAVAYDDHMAVPTVSRGLRGGRQEGGGAPAALPGVWLLDDFLVGLWPLGAGRPGVPDLCAPCPLR